MNALAAMNRRRDVTEMLDSVWCVDALTLLGSLPDNSIDLVVTSPPYDNLRTYNGFTWEFEPIARETYRVLKSGGVCVWVVGDATVNGSETLTSFRQALYFVDVCGFRMHDTMIWEKYLPGVYGKRYVHAFEYMFVLSKGEPVTFNPLTRPNVRAGQKRTGSQRFGGNTQNGHVKQARTFIVAERGILENVWYIPSGGGKTSTDGTVHAGAFPETLAERHILTWSNPDDIVVDYFCGSGTTLKMARNHQRYYIGGDISAEYVALSRKRLAQPYNAQLFPESAFAIESAAP